MDTDIKLIECPRDAMQGIVDFIPTDHKIKYINQLLKVGFHTIDVGSFVSHKSIPQLKDTSKVLSNIDLSETISRLLVIIANLRGAYEASEYDQIDYLGFPLSVSEEFQKRNTNKTIYESFSVLQDIQNICVKKNKRLVVYLSMAFGNPYGEDYHPDIVVDLIDKLFDIEIPIISLSDTIGVSSSKHISILFKNLILEYTDVEFGAHLHSHPNNWKEKIDAAYDNGCRRFDSAIKGYGGCPMAHDKLVGNIQTEKLVEYFNLPVNNYAFESAVNKSLTIFN